MASKDHITLTDTWVEVADGAATLVLIDGSKFWVNNGPSAPVNDKSYTPIFDFYSYGGTEKTFARKASGTSGNTMKISVIEIL